jgi:glycosyltransferase involved in cell wall biosynthesis
MATQTPVVSSDCPSGPAEILIGGKYGELVPIGDANAMAKGIVKALATPPVKRVELQKRAEDFMCGTIAEEYLAFFAQSIPR